MTKEINELINISLKHHQSAGVTLALMACGMANNVARSPQNATLHCRWKAPDQKSQEMGLAPITLPKPDKVSTRLNCQPEHIEVASLGVFDEAKIDVRTVEMS